MTELLQNIGELATILYTILILGHILNRGLIEKTFDDLQLLDEEDR